MKIATIRLILPLLIALVSCSSTAKAQEEASQKEGPPQWYLESEAPLGFLIGYGEGESREIAADKARNDLAKQIEVQIKSDFSIKESGSAENSTFLYEQNISTLVDIVLYGAQPLKEKVVNGWYYAAWIYDNRPMRSRALEAALQGGPVPEEKSLKHSLPFTRYLETNRVPAGYQLDYRQDNWYLLIGNISIPISRNELAENFFPLVNTDRLVLNQGLKNGLTVSGLKPDELKEGQYFSIIYYPINNEPGYLNLFYIDNRGVTLNLIENQKISGNEVEYPDLTLYNGLIAEVETNFDQSTDVILAVETSEPLNYASFIRKVTSNQVDTEEDGMFSYGLLLEQLDTTNCSSMIVRIAR